MLRGLAAMLAATGFAAAVPSTTVMMSQIYGGGGNGGAAFTHDFVELHNISSAPVVIDGWSVQYASSAGVANNGNWGVAPINGTIPAGGYFLVRLATGNVAIGAALPTEDASGGLNLSATAGKVALVNSTTPLTGITPFTSGASSLVDFVGFGVNVSDSETAPAPAPSNGTSISRGLQGSVDTDNNSADFEAAAVPVPRNSATAPFIPTGDTTPPTYTTLSPATGGTTAVTSNLVVTFSEPMVAAAGSVSLYTSSGGLVETIPAASAAVTIAGGTVTINPTADLLPGRSYYVLIGATAFRDSAGNNFPGILGTSDWTFSTSGTDATGPRPLTLSPVNGATGISPSTTLSIRFDEFVRASTSPIGIRILREASPTDVVVETIPANSDNVIWQENSDTVQILLSTQLAAGATYHVEIPAGAFTDTAPTPNGNLAFGGETGATPWTFSTAGTAGLTVVVNKYLNGSPDLIELLVVGNGTPGSTVDMRNMLVKDFSGSMANDSGGPYRFNDVAAWSAVPAGTLIVLSADGTTTDANAADDFTMRVGLLDAGYFTSEGSSLDIAAIEMIMIKSAGSPAAGLDGGIHVLAGGEPGAQFTSFSGAKLLAGGGSATNLTVAANNSAGVLADYLGSDATGGLADLVGNFGFPTTTGNAAFIASLRGANVSQGNGTATVVNITSGTFANSMVFAAGTTGQTAAITVRAASAGITLSNIRLDVDPLLGAPTLANVTLSGAGAAGATRTVAGQVITISGAAVTSSSDLVVTITGISTPTPVAGASDGNFPIRVSTAGTGFLPLAIAVHPAVRVKIPIANLRVNTDVGLSVHNSKTVVVEGVCTEENFSLAGTNGFIQDATGGVNIFSSSLVANMVRGNRYLFIGRVVMFRGLTEIDPTNTPTIFDLGPATVPAPQTIPLATLMANPEAYEGLLITVPNISRTTATPVWGSATTIRMTDGTVEFDLRIQAGSTATTQPAYTWMTVTGIFGQFNPSTAAPFFNGYQLMPRDPSDLAEGQPPATGTTFASWIGGYNVGNLTGLRDDFDGDGLPNGIENYLGSSPSVSNAGLTAVSATSTTVKFRHQRSNTIATDIVGSYKWSTDLVTWNNAGATSAGGVTVGIASAVITDNAAPANDVIEVTATVTGGTAAKIFVRLSVEQ